MSNEVVEPREITTGTITALPGELGPFQIAPQVPSIYIDQDGGAWGIETPSADFTPAADPHVQALVQENAQLKAERDRLAAINARLQRKLDKLRNGVVALSERIKEER